MNRVQLYLTLLPFTFHLKWDAQRMMDSYTSIEGLWFVGAQSEIGGGVNNVIPGAYRVAKNIISHE